MTFRALLGVLLIAFVNIISALVPPGQHGSHLHRHGSGLNKDGSNLNEDGSRIALSCLGKNIENDEITRRSLLRELLLSFTATSFLPIQAANAVANDVANVGTASGSVSRMSSGEDLSNVITHKVFMDVRISRADGTFYVRKTSSSSSSEEEEADDEPFYGTLVLGLFGQRYPNHVRQFLQFVEVPYQVDDPLPSYSRSRFSTLDAATGLLLGGQIPGLDLSELAGGAVFKYGSRVLPARLWIEDNSDNLTKSDNPKNSDNLNESDNPKNSDKLSHSAKGYLTHRNLDASPKFGLTTRNNNPDGAALLDNSHTIFGCVLSDDGFLNAIVDLPTLSADGKVARTTFSNDVIISNANNINNANNAALTQELASGLFTAQRKIFRDAAKTFGDSRLDKTYDGKLLRRVEVTKVGILKE